MEKINIAELLKDYPKGMELDCTMFDDVKFIEIEDDDKPICIRTGDIYRYLTKFGTWTFDENAKCVIFPKGKTTWEGFTPPCKFKDGDILFVKSVYSWVLVYKESENNEDLYKYIAIQDTPKHTYIVYNNKPLCCKEDVSEIRLATKEEKQKLFDTIKANGYKWNSETKTLEKLVEPKFKVGDKIRHKETNKDDVYEISKVYDDSYGLVDFTWMIYMKYQDQYELAPDKFDINTLVPFESKVLVRDINTDKWIGAFYSHCKSNGKKFYTIGSSYYYQCIPYEGNEHLLDTTDDCDNFYKTW